jgi:hypothetical protein
MTDKRGLREAELERRVLADYRTVSGTVVRVVCLKGCTENGDTRELDYTDNPIPVKIGEGTVDIRWMDGEWIDPYWPVTPLENRPGMEGLHGWEIHGDSYRYETEARVGRFKALLLKACHGIWGIHETPSTIDRTRRGSHPNDIL